MPRTATSADEPEEDEPDDWLDTDPNFQFVDVPAGRALRLRGPLARRQRDHRGCNPPANDMYCPEDPLTRGQMAALLYRGLTD